LRVSGDVVEDEDTLRMERLGLKAVRRRRREVDEERRGVKDWKRLVRLEEDILACSWFWR
jgi:hypothetical protein